MLKKAAILGACLLLCLAGAACSYRQTPPPAQTENLDVSATAPPTPTPCPHEVWNDGICADCSEVCAHTWEEGVCSVCGAVCAHESYDAETRCCTVCALRHRHLYSGDTCTVCGAVFEFSSTPIPREFTGECPQPGTLESFSYIVPDYLRQEMGDVGREWEKNILVYLPYGYDPAKQYDLLILMHGDHCREDYWLTQERKDRLGKVCMRNVLDNLIAEGLCSEMIVACPTFYGYDVHGAHRANTSQSGVGYERELKEYVLPMLAERYSTYAASGSAEDLRAARDHIGYVGFSRGSLIGYGSVLTECRDMVSWIGCLSGIADSANLSMAYYIQGALTDGDYDAGEYPIHLIYHSGGEDDPAWPSQVSHVKALHEMENQLVEGENSFVCQTEGDHGFRSWSKGLYDCLQLFFTYDTTTGNQP